MTNANRVMDWLREGYGVEDAARYMAVPLEDVRAVVAGFRADGSLRERLIIEPGNGNFIHCKAGHFQTAENMELTKRGRTCRVCHNAARRRRAKVCNQSMFGSYA